MKAGLKVFAPASIGNVGIGFDCMGMAVEKPGDEVIVKPSDTPGLKITKITGAKGKLPYEVDKNTAGFAAKKAEEERKQPPIPFSPQSQKENKIEQSPKIPRVNDFD